MEAGGRIATMLRVAIILKRFCARRLQGRSRHGRNGAMRQRLGGMFPRSRSR